MVRQPTLPRYLAAFAVTCAIPLNAGAAERPALKEVKPSDLKAEMFDGALDKHPDGKIDAAEMAVFLKHQKSDAMRVADVDRDGKLSGPELAAYDEFLNERIAGRMSDFNPSPSQPAAPQPVATVNRDFREKGPADTGPLFGFRIRKDADDVSVVGKPKPFAKAESALFSYARDFENDNDLLTVHGAVLYPVPLPIRNAVITNSAVAPSVTVDRVSNSDSGKRKNDVDSVVLRGRGEFELARLGPIDGHLVRAGYAFGTDTDWDSKNHALELQYEPYVSAVNLGGPAWDVGPVFAWRWGAIAHAEVGRTAEAGGKANLRDDDDFARVGPKLNLEIWPLQDVLQYRLKLDVKYGYLWGISGEPERSELFSVAAEYRLDDAGHVNLTIEYRNGDIPLSQDNVDLLTFGVGVKY